VCETDRHPIPYACSTSVLLTASPSALRCSRAGAHVRARECHAVSCACAGAGVLRNCSAYVRAGAWIDAWCAAPTHNRAPLTEATRHQGCTSASLTASPSALRCSRAGAHVRARECHAVLRACAGAGVLRNCSAYVRAGAWIDAWCAAPTHNRAPLTQVMRHQGSGGANSLAKASCIVP
jgi:hypothetical protein